MFYMAEKESTNIEIKMHAKAALDRIYNDTGVVRVQIATRLLCWFADQDKSLQSLVLSQIEESDQLQLLDMIKDRIEAEKVNSSADHALDAHKEHERKPKKRTRSKGA